LDCPFGPRNKGKKMNNRENLLSEFQ